MNDKKPIKDAPTDRPELFTRPGFLIRRLHQIHSALFYEETEAFKITPVQYSLLSVLEQWGELDQNSLAHNVGLERTSVAEVLPRLEQRDLLTRRASERDKRVRLVKLTRKGRALVRRMTPAALRAHERTVEHLCAEDRQTFIEAMALLVEADDSNRTPPFKAR